MAAYGRGGLKAQGLNAVKYIGRLYWYTVEFGLIRHKDGGYRIYGAGITSSKTESIYSVESDAPNRIAFDLQRMMQTDFDITKLQDVYFVIDSFEQLFEATFPDFTPYYEQLKQKPSLSPRDVLESDLLLPKPGKR
jgi:phenylalanine-4-hydroxylase